MMRPFLCLIACILVLGPCRLVLAQMDDPIPPYQRIFVPQSDLKSLLPAEFLPIKISELEQLLTASREVSNPPFESQPTLTQMWMVASLVGEDLVSDISRMEIHHDDEVRAAFDARPLSIALRSVNIPSIRIKNNQVFSTMTILKDGTPRWFVDETSSIWFGWTLRPKNERESKGRALEYQLTIPPCPIGKMVLKLPPQWRADSDRAVVRRITNVTETLPEDWPDRGAIARDGENWWEISFGGLTDVDLRVSRIEENKIQTFANVMSTLDVEYTVSLSGLYYRCQWAPHRTADASVPWRIRIDPRLRLRNLSFAGRTISWELKGEWIEIAPRQNANKGDADSKWMLEASMAWKNDAPGITASDDSSSLYLPSMAIGGATSFKVRRN
ncbi:MAG: hypothetical protein U0905_20035 [Pirellulales bacterium]